MADSTVSYPYYRQTSNVHNVCIAYGNVCLSPLGVSSNGSDFSNVSVVNLTISQWSGVYAGLVGTVVLLSIARMFLVFVLLMRASHLLHNKMFAAVLRAPVLFFDTNPVGEHVCYSNTYTGALTYSSLCCACRSDTQQILKGHWLHG